MVITKSMRLPVIVFAAIVIIFLSIILRNSYYNSSHVNFVEKYVKDVFENEQIVPKTVEQPIDLRKKVVGYQNTIDSSAQGTEKHLNEIWNYVYNKQYICSDIEEIGGNPQNRDGFYPVCKEPKFWKLTSDKNAKCLVYSFGVGGDFSFDDGVAAKGCEVHSFDPSSPYEDGWVRESGVTFHKIGIYEYDTDQGPHGWKMRTLASIIKMLGHQKRIIDILKVDIDSDDGGGYEDLFMNNMILSGLHNCVRQYDVEIHYNGPLTGPNNRYLRCQVIWEQLQYLHQHGYKIFQTTDNIRAAPKYTQLMRKNDFLKKATTMLWEISFVNENVLEECPT